MIFQNSLNSTDKRGFTLAELVVSMALIVIVLALSVSFISLISSYTSREQSNNESIIEYQRVMTLLDEFRDTYNIFTFSIENITDNALNITDGDEVYALSFDVSHSTLDATILKNGEMEDVSLSFNKISNISFAISGEVIDVKIEFISFATRHYLLNFGAFL